MKTKRAPEDWLFRTNWVHVFEEDTSQGAVYRADDDERIPLSRRPRHRLELCRDGSARLFVPGPDDRLVERRATWSAGARVRKHRRGEGLPEIKIVDRSPERLIVQVPRKAPTSAE